MKYSTRPFVDKKKGSSSRLIKRIHKFADKQNKKEPVDEVLEAQKDLTSFYGG